MTRQRTRSPRPVAPRVMPRRGGSRPAVAVTTVLVALLVGALLNAGSLAATAAGQPIGWRRDLAMTATGPLVDVSEALGLTGLRDRLDHVFAGRDPSLAVPVTPTPDATPEPPATVTPPTPGPTTPRATPMPTPSPTVAAPVTATPEHPARLLIAGDSLTEAMGPALANLALRTDMITPTRELRYSAGLTRPDFFDWPAFLASQLAAEPADLVVFMIGGNDAQKILVGDGWEDFGTPVWQAEYRRRVAATMDVLTATASRVYWVGQPIPRSVDFAGRMAILNAIYADEAARRPTVTYVSSWDVFADPDGNYSAYLPDPLGTPTLVRRSDGIHFTPTGGQWLADAVFDLVARDCGIAAG